MIIHLVKTCSAVDYETQIEVDDYKQTKWGIKITFNDKPIQIPFSNIAAIEDE